MKELEQKAEQLLFDFYKTIPLDLKPIDAHKLAKKQATQSVNYVIEVLKDMKNNCLDNWYHKEKIHSKLNEQIELKKILEGRL